VIRLSQLIYCQPNCQLSGFDVGRLLALGALHNFKADFLPFFERLESAHVDRGEVREQVIASIIRGDKTKTLCFVKPFNYTGCHLILSLLMKQGHPLRVLAILKYRLPQASKDTRAIFAPRTARLNANTATVGAIKIEVPSLLGA
jgi:hypothetical protein